MRKFLIDTDTGSDDAVALVMALMAPGVRVEAITVVAGNVPLEQAVQNALFTAELCQSDVPVYAGAAHPLVADLVTAQFVHGDDGMGDIGLPLAGRAPTPGHAVEALLACAEQHAGELTLVTLGPLTNVAMALRLRPELAQQIERCVVMGGTGKGPGNITPVAEFNIYVDPEAAQVVFASGLPITMVGWDISVESATFGPDDAKRLKGQGTRLADFCVEIQRVLDKYSRQETGLVGFDLPDPIAMAIAIDESVAVETVARNVVVETGNGLCRGQTVIDHLGVTGRDPNATIVVRADREAFLSQLHRAVEADP